MATAAKLVTDLSVTLRGIRSHEGVVAARRVQARRDDTAQYLHRTDAREQVVADRVARALRGLGAPTPRLRPSWFPSPTSLVAAAGSYTQPLGEALVLEATALRMVADRARVVHGLAVALDETVVADVATQVTDLYDDYAGWLVRTAAALVVDEDSAELVPTATQRLAGRVKDAVGAPARIYGHVADRAAGGVGEVTGRLRSLVGLGGEKLDEAADTVTAAVADTATAVRDAVDTVEVGDLAVTRYDSRSAADAAKAVRGLADVEDVSAVLAYEAQHKDRKTVLDAGDKRVAELTGANA